MGLRKCRCATENAGGKKENAGDFGQNAFVPNIELLRIINNLNWGHLHLSQNAGVKNKRLHYGNF
jgi:hypothetical protein